MPEVLKFSTSKNTFKSYTVGKKNNGPSSTKNLDELYFRSVSQNYLMLFISDLIDIYQDGGQAKSRVMTALNFYLIYQLRMCFIALF